MSPSPHSPTTKLSFQHRTSSQDSGDGIRKRVCKACDRCRLKKSKCDGANPCSRCKTDNAICVFGERKKSHDKIYPKGYVEMLEQQQSQLVSGLQEMYRRLQSAHAWDGDILQENNGHPLTHDILASLDLIDSKHDGATAEMFEEDVQKIQSRLISEGHGFVQRRGSISSDSEHSQHGQQRPAKKATPALSRQELFRDSFSLGSSTSSPLVQSPIPQQSQPRLVSQPPEQQQFQNDPQLYAPEWAQALSEASKSQQLQTRFQQTPDDLDGLLINGQWTPGFDNVMNGLQSFPQYAALGHANDAASLDGMDVDFSKFVNPAAAMEVYI